MVAQTDFGAMMSAKWTAFNDKIDAMTLRERVLIFVMAAVVLLTLVNTILLDPLLAKQKATSQQIVQQQSKIQAMQTQIQELVQARQTDPDAVNRARLAEVKQQLEKMNDELLGMQKGLVAPSRMGTLLEDILRHNKRLQVVSLKTLPVSGITQKADETGAQSSAQSAPEAQASLIYKHGVVLTLAGNYLDILQYTKELEVLPWQMYWGNVTVATEDYPRVTMTLTLYTLSLDKSWLSI
jgi:MSHA biogenesis protein MshJ